MVKQRRTILGIALWCLVTTVFFASYSTAAEKKTVTNIIGMQFVQIPSGSFYMGSCMENPDMIEQNKKRKFMGQPLSVTHCPSGAAIDKEARSYETPQHKVTISKSFYMGKYEVTVGQFKKYIADTGRTGLLTEEFIKANSHGDNAAVSYVSWDDAQGFISWLNGKKGVDTYRLPTEAEWEYACRAGTKTRFFFGDNETALGQYAWYNTNADHAGKKFAQPVGKKLPNPWGLYDIHGNVFEWCQDWYGDYPSDSLTDPQGQSSGSLRVLRGGSWYGSPDYCRSSYRNLNVPGNRCDILGFRLILLPGQ